MKRKGYTTATEILAKNAKADRELNRKMGKITRAMMSELLWKVFPPIDHPVKFDRKAFDEQMRRIPK
jgi:hypothetical protein